MGLSIWPGYQARIQKTDSGLFLQIKSEHEVVRTQQTVLDELALIREVNEGRCVDFIDDMTQYICGQTVITSYNNRAYKIDDLRFDMSAESRFDYKNSKITFAEYMLNRYKLTVKFPS